MTIRLPNSFDTYNTAANITNTDAVVALPSIISATAEQYCLTEIAITNTSATTTLLRVLGNSEVKWNVPAPGGSGAVVKFNPALNIGASEALRIQAKAGAEIEVSLRAYKARL